LAAWQVPSPRQHQQCRPRPLQQQQQQQQQVAAPQQALVRLHLPALQAVPSHRQQLKRLHQLPAGPLAGHLQQQQQQQDLVLLQKTVCCRMHQPAHQWQQWVGRLVVAQAQQAWLQLCRQLHILQQLRQQRLPVLQQQLLRPAKALLLC
jgi:hypothetical protein